MLARGGSTATITSRLRRLGLPAVRGASAHPGADRLEPAGLRQPRHPRQRRAGVLPRRRVRQRGRERHLRPEVQRGVGRKRGAVPPTRTGPTRSRSGSLGMDDPPFVEHMAEFTRTHRRIEFLAYDIAGPVRSGISREATEPRGLPTAHPAPRLIRSLMGRRLASPVGNGGPPAEHVSDSSVLRAPPCSSALS